MQAEHVAEVEGPVGLGERREGGGIVAGLALAGLADWQPLVVGLEGGIAAGNPVTFRLALVVLGSAAPAVVGGFVVVPTGDQRRDGAQVLQVDVGVVPGVALAVVVEADDLAVRQEASVCGRILGGPIATGTIFIDVIAQMQ